MSTESYNTLLRASKSLIKDRGSKFYGFAFHVQNEEEVKSHLSELKKKYYDARHHCFAYVLGEEADTYRVNDDGEPSHSAGDPILGQLRSNQLTNSLIVVVRYFGGTKLGVSGLIAAYKNAASGAIESNQIIKKYVTEEITILFKYQQMNAVMRIIKSMGLKIIEQDFELDCKIILEIKPDQEIQIRESLEVYPMIEIKH